MKYYTYPQAPRLTKFLHLRTLDEKGVFVFYSHHLLWRKFINRLALAQRSADAELKVEASRGLKSMAQRARAEPCFCAVSHIAVN